MTIMRWIRVCAFTCSGGWSVCGGRHTTILLVVGVGRASRSLSYGAELSILTSSCGSRALMAFEGCSITIELSGISRRFFRDNYSRGRRHWLHFSVHLWRSFFMFWFSFDWWWPDTASWFKVWGTISSTCRVVRVWLRVRMYFWEGDAWWFPLGWVWVHIS